MSLSKTIHKMTRDGKFRKVMHEYKSGTLHSGSSTGPKVKKRSQAIAIAFSESRRRR